MNISVSDDLEMKSVAPESIVKTIFIDSFSLLKITSFAFQKFLCVFNI